MSVPQRNYKGVRIGDRFTIVFRRSNNGTYLSWTGQTMLAQIRDLDGVLRGTGTVSYSTNTVADDTVTVNWPKAITELLEAGTYTYEIEWIEDEQTLQSGKVQFTTDRAFT